jgi:uncharacterized protein YggU (UPF0235/DUF167 family)
MRSNGGDQHDSPLYFDVLVRPGASTDSIVISGRTLRIQVRKKAEGGAANLAVIRLVAKKFGVNTEQVQIVRGMRGKRKLIRINK